MRMNVDQAGDAGVTRQSISSGARDHTSAEPTLKIRSSLTTTTAFSITVPVPVTSFPNRITFGLDSAKHVSPSDQA